MLTNSLPWSLPAAASLILALTPSPAGNGPSPSLVRSSVPCFQGAAAETWVALGLPSIAEPPPAAPVLPILETGSHLLLEIDEPELRGRPEAPSLGIASLLGLLQDDLTRRRLPLKLLPNAPPILVRGDAPALEHARAGIDELDRIGRALQVEVRAWWIEGRIDVPVHPDAATVKALESKGAPLGARSIRSGAVAELGARELAGYVAGYEVEVATDAGVADPEVARIVTGRTLHLRACRVRGGRQVHLEGFFDVARLASLVDFECGTPDLGTMQIPTVEAVQVAFGGVVDSGGALAVTLENVAGTTGTLLVAATASPDPTGLATWRAADLALLETLVQELPLPSPGAGIARPGEQDQELAVLRQPVTSATLAQIADESSRATKGTQRPVAAWSSGLLVAAAADPSWAEVDGLIGAAEKERTLSYEVVAEHGGSRVRLPATEGLALRVMVSTERTLLVDYEVHVAQESWMPSPQVEHVVDGWLVQGHCSAGTLACVAWIASTPESRRLERDQIGIGSMDLLRRKSRKAQARVVSGSEREVLSPEPGAASAQGGAGEGSAGLKVVLQGGRP